jgi:hypothetical protein
MTMIAKGNLSKMLEPVVDITISASQLTESKYFGSVDLKTEQRYTKKVRHE